MSISREDATELPTSWKVYTLNEITDPDAPIRYGVVQIGPEVAVGVPIVPIKFINTIISAPLHRASPDIESKYSGSRIKGGDVLLSVKGTIGAVGVVPDGFCGNIAREIARIRPAGQFDPHFVAFQLQADETQKRIEKLTVGSTRREFSIHTVRKFRIAVPPFPEQKAIADLIGTWDTVIEKTERLIQAKEKRFEHLLDNLIFSPTITGQWPEVSTRSVFQERKEGNRGDLPLLSITNSAGVIPHSETNRKDISNQDKSKYLRICAGDIGYNTMRMWQGVSALSSLEGIVSPAYTICIPGEKLCPQFIAYLFKTPFMIHRFYRYSQGLTSDTWNLKYRHFSEVKMPLPTLAEQERIAEILSSSQLEVDLLKKIADKYKFQKRGLMQKMLTGAWRVKPEIINQYMEA